MLERILKQKIKQNRLILTLYQARMIDSIFYNKNLWNYKTLKYKYVFLNLINNILIWIVKYEEVKNDG